MNPNKVYPVQVGWKGTRKGSTETGNVQVRLIMAGAQVVPSEQPLDPAEPQATVTFYVTPLAKGWLRGERAEVIQNGRKIGEVRTPTKVITQRKTWLLLLLTLLLPWMLGNFFGHELSEEVYDKSANQNIVGGVEKKQSAKGIDNPQKKDGEEVVKPGTKPPVVKGEPQLPKTDLPKKKPIKAGDVLEHHIREIVPEVLPPVQQHAGEYTHYITDIPSLLGGYYTFTYYSYKNYHVPYYSFWILVLLTLISYFWHREKRKTQVGQPIEVES